MTYNQLIVVIMLSLFTSAVSHAQDMMSLLNKERGKLDIGGHSDRYLTASYLITDRISITGKHGIHNVDFDKQMFELKTEYSLFPLNSRIDIIPHIDLLADWNLESLRYGLGSAQQYSNEQFRIFYQFYFNLDNQEVHHLGGAAVKVFEGIWPFAEFGKEVEFLRDSESLYFGTYLNSGRISVKVELEIPHEEKEFKTEFTRFNIEFRYTILDK